MNYKKRYLFKLHEKLFIISVLLIVFSVTILFLVISIINYFKNEILVGEFLINFVISMIVILVFLIILNINKYKFSFVIISNEIIKFVCHKKKYNKSFSFDQIKSIQIETLSYSGYKRFSAQKFIVISTKEPIIKKSKIIVDNYIKFIKNDDVIICNYNEDDYNYLAAVIKKS